MRDHPTAEGHSAEPLPEAWTGRATNRGQWLLAAAGAACIALGVELAVDSTWTSGFAPLLMSVVGCIAAGLLVLFGTLAFVHVAVRVDGDCLEVRCGHMGLPRRRIPLAHVVDADFAPRVTPRQWGGWGYRWRPEKGTAVVVRRGEGLCCSSATAGLHHHGGRRGGGRTDHPRPAAPGAQGHNGRRLTAIGDPWSVIRGR